MRTNEERQERGRKLVEMYAKEVGVSIEVEGEDTCAIDAIADILHWAHSCGHDIQRVVRWGYNHCGAELGEETDNATNP